MVYRRRDPGLTLFPSTRLGWIGLAAIAIFYVALIVSFQFTTLVLPWLAVIASVIGIVSGLIAAMRKQDFSIILGVAAAISLTISPFIFYFLLGGQR
jgi:hypothetical protein